MQWTTAELHNWEELRPYVDSALLPLYLYRPGLPVPEHAERMTYLMALASEVERRLKGRLLLFPLAYQVAEHEAGFRLPEAFRHSFILRFSGDVWHVQAGEGQGRVHYLTVGDEELDSRVRFEVTADVLKQEIVRTWQEQGRAKE